MFLHIAGGEIAFPNFKDFMNSDGPFQLSYPDANLQPTKFAINDEARNFPKEAIERLGEGQKAKEKADKTLKTISGPIWNIGAQFKPKNITQPVLILILKPKPFVFVATSNNVISEGRSLSETTMLLAARKQNGFDLRFVQSINDSAGSRL